VLKTDPLGSGTIIRSNELRYIRDGAAEVATPICPEVGSRWVTLHVVRIPAGESWRPTQSAAEENVAVIFTGGGEITVGDSTSKAVQADTAYAPTGRELELTGGEQGMTAYVWRAPLLDGRTPPADPRLHSSLWNEETQLKGFAGTGQIPPSDKPATMNFVFWPGTGSCQMCLHCGIQQPGETFNVHLHTHSEEAFISLEGQGQMFLGDTWYDVEPGDILYAEPMILHGTRNPHTGPDAQRFVTCGGPIPWDPFLYDAAGVSTEVIG